MKTKKSQTKKSQTKTIIKILVSFFALYLCIYYWQGISGIIGSVLKAALPILVGCVIAYPLNILMSFYERHFFPHSNKKFICRSRRAFCLLFAFATSLAIIALVVALIVPQLVSCVKLLIAEVPSAFTSC